MNRLETPAPPTVSPDFQLDHSKVFEFRVRRDDSQAAPLEYFRPQHYEKHYAYPLIIWLHGAHDTETQLRKVMPLTSTRNFVAVGPRGTHKDHLPSAAHVQTYHWSQEQAGIDAAGILVSSALERAQRHFNVHADRIFLAGYQDGGTMALRLALQSPHQFAGVISINGPLPRGGAPLRNFGQTGSLPLLLMHCQQSEYFPEHQLCNDIRLGYSARLRMDIREYLCGDGIVTDMLSDMNSWVMSQVLG